MILDKVYLCLTCFQSSGIALQCIVILTALFCEITDAVRTWMENNGKRVVLTTVLVKYTFVSLIFYMHNNAQ